MTTTAKKCEFCDKRGLPLLLVRDAIAPAGAGAPPSADQPHELVGNAAHYTKRLLRSGYLNVYDEARKRWEVYFVTSDGYYFKVSQISGVVPVLPKKPFNCPDEGHAAVASCITVPDPVNATRVWIGFSETLWTAGVRKKNESPAYRKRHMVVVDVKAALAGNKVMHTRPISQVPAIVAEYAMSKDKGLKAFAWNSTAFVPRQGRAERLQKECDALRPGKALIVTVPDPVGITHELALLTQHKVEEFTQEPLRRRLLLADQRIAAVEQGIRDRAKLLEQKTAEDLANQQAQSSGLLLWLSGDARKQNESLRHVSPSEAKRAADQQWASYQEKFYVKERETWRQDYLKKLNEHDKNIVAPLSASHVGWLRSEDLAAYFECNFDSKDPATSADYIRIFNLCGVGTQDKGPAVEQYKKWLEGDFRDTKNLMLRMLVGNQDKIADAVQKAAETKIDWRSIPWDNLFAIFKETLGRFATHAYNAFTDAIVTYAGAIAGVFHRALDSKYGVRGAVMALGLISGHPITVITLTGKRKEFRAAVAKAIIARSGVALDPRKLSAAIGAEMTLQGLDGVRMDGDVRLTYMAPINSQIAGMPSGLTPEEQVSWAVKNMLSAKAIDELNAARFRNVISVDVRGGMVAAILQAISLSKLLEDDTKALDNSSVDARARLVAGMAALTATTGEIVGNMWRGALALRSSTTIASTAPAKLLLVARYLGIAAGVTVAVFDGIQGYKAFHEGQRGLALLYIGAALSGLGLTLALAYASSLSVLLGAAFIPVLGILFLIVVGIGIIIEYVKDNPIQEWLKRCPWGKLKDDRYRDEVTEQAQFMKAIAE